MSIDIKSWSNNIEGLVDGGAFRGSLSNFAGSVTCPPLPEPLSEPWPWPPPDDAKPYNYLYPGCYLVRFIPARQFHPEPRAAFQYDGTIRLVRANGVVRASGDLYRHKAAADLTVADPIAGASDQPDPAHGVPTFPIRDYSHYMAVNRIQGGSGWAGVDIDFDLYSFEAATNSWPIRSAYTAALRWTGAPQGYPMRERYLTGEVKNQAGQRSGTMRMGWVSPFLRAANIRIGHYPGQEIPMDNGLGVDWASIFADAGWKVTAHDREFEDSTASSAENKRFDRAECHEMMLTRLKSRDPENTSDNQWTYNLLCLTAFEGESFGIMFDNGAWDSDNVPREGAAVFTDCRFSKNQDKWGAAKGKRLGRVKGPYFRTAVHEIGHAMSLHHNRAGCHIMRGTYDIAEGAGADGDTFTDRIKYCFSVEDVERLRHMPDMWVRPGGTIPFFTAYTIGPHVEVYEAEGLDLLITPHLDLVPLGAPVRLNIELKNNLDRSMTVPYDLGLKGGAAWGSVVGPSGSVRSFSPLVINLDAVGTQTLSSGKSRVGSMTLMRGGQGTLFPATGAYRILIWFVWKAGEINYKLFGQTAVMVMDAEGKQHASAALGMIVNPEAYLSFVLGSDYFPEAVCAIQKALASDVLKNHLAILEAKRLGRLLVKGKETIESLKGLIDDHTVMTGAEAASMAKIAKEMLAVVQKSSDDREVQESARKEISRIAKILKKHADQEDKYIREIIDGLL